MGEQQQLGSSRFEWCSLDMYKACSFPRWCWGLLLGLAGGISVLCLDVMSHHVRGHPHRSIIVLRKLHLSQNVSRRQKSPWPWTVPRVWDLAAFFPPLERHTTAAQVHNEKNMLYFKQEAKQTLHAFVTLEGMEACRVATRNGIQPDVIICTRD